MAEGSSRRFRDMNKNGLSAGNPSRCFECSLAMALNKFTDETCGHRFCE
jgi:hypothetical protein